jgi:heat shock protein HtpX
MLPRRNIYEQQARNRRLTALLMVGFILLLALVGFGFDIFYLHMRTPWRPRAPGPSFPLATLFAVCLSSGSAWWSFRFGDWAILASTQARFPLPSTLGERQFQNVVQEMAIASGLPLPRAYVIPDPDPNAFATGRDPAHASIAVTEGLLRVLNRDELQGVVAHEMAHIKNYDIRLMTVTAALVGAIALLADWAARVRVGRSDRGDDRDKGGALGLIVFAVWILAIILAPLASQMLAMAVSRRREYLADATGAELTRNPLALAAALKKIDAAAEPTRAINRGIAHLCIADPLERKFTDHEGFLGDLFATHPPIKSRIFALEQMAYRYATRERAAAGAQASARPA